MDKLDSNTIQIQNASLEDSEDFVRLLLISEPNLYREIFGKNYTKVLELLFISKSNNFSHENVILAKKGDRSLGMLVGYAYRELSKMIFNNSITFLKVMKVGFLRSLPAFIKLGRSMVMIEDGDFYISNIAVYPEYRGMGIGTKLMEKAEEIALNSGYDRIALDVSYNNEGAMAFYKKLGFQRLEEGKDVKIHNQTFKFIRFVKYLREPI